MKVANPENRLAKFWGKVDRKQILTFLRYVRGPRVLDVGCGYGSTLNMIRRRLPEVSCVGIEPDPDSRQVATRLFPHLDIRPLRCEELPFEDHSFDTVILRDTLHHLFEEGDFSRVKQQLQRVTRPGGRVIVYDPNVNFLLKTLRKLSAHKDAECNFEQAKTLMAEMKLKVIHTRFNTFCSLPASGGYVGINFVPPVRLIQRSVLLMDHIAEGVFNALRLGRHLCLRYLIVGEKSSLGTL